MKTIIEQESPTKLRVLIEVEQSELDPLYDETLKRLAKETNIPGFRKGKVPTQLLESRLGKEAVSQEMLKDALPHFYDQAISENEVRTVALPEIEVTQFEMGEPLHFTATVDVKPDIALPEYKSIEVDRPKSEVTEEEITDQLERLRERFGTLEPIGRNATKGDYVTIDLHAYKHDQKIEEASAQDLLYEVGSGSFVTELDTELEGKRAGDILKFNATLPERFPEPHGGSEVAFSVIVKEVQAKRLPTLDDEFAKTASEFDKLEELKAEIKLRVETLKAAEAESEVRRRLVDELVERAEVPVPDSMVTRETEARLVSLLRDLERAGLELEQYLEAAKTTREELIEEQRKAATRAIAAQLVLEAIARAEDIDVSEGEIDLEIQNLSKQIDRKYEEVRKDLEESGRVQFLAGDILRRKTLDFLIEQAKVGEGS